MKKFEFGWSDLIALVPATTGAITVFLPLSIGAKMNILILILILVGLVSFYYYKHIIYKINGLRGDLSKKATADEYSNLRQELIDHRDKENDLRRGIQEEYQKFVDNTNNRFEPLEKRHASTTSN